MDQGSNIEAETVIELSDLMNIKIFTTSIYRPDWKIISKRINRTLLGIVEILEPHINRTGKNI